MVMMMIMALHWMVWVMEATLWTEGLWEGTGRCVDIWKRWRGGWNDQYRAVTHVWRLVKNDISTAVTAGVPHMTAARTLRQNWELSERPDEIQRDYKEHITKRLQWKCPIWTNTPLKRPFMQGARTRWHVKLESVLKNPALSSCFLNAKTSCKNSVPRVLYVLEVFPQSNTPNSGHWMCEIKKTFKMSSIGGAPGPGLSPRP